MSQAKAWCMYQPIYLYRHIALQPVERCPLVFRKESVLLLREGPHPVRVDHSPGRRSAGAANPSRRCAVHPRHRLLSRSGEALAGTLRPVREWYRNSDTVPQSSAHLSGQSHVLHGNPYDSPAEAVSFVPGQGNPATTPQYLGAFRAPSQFDSAVNSPSYANVPFVAHTTGRSESTVIVGIPFYPNSPLAWSTPATSASHLQDQRAVAHDALYRPVDWGVYRQHYHGQH